MPPLRLLTRGAESLFSDREQNHGRVWGRKQQLFWYGVIHSALCTVLITFTSVGRIQFRMASMMRLLHAPASPVWPCATHWAWCHFCIQASHGSRRRVKR